MKSRDYMLNTILAVIVGVSVLAGFLIKTFYPATLLPGMNLSTIAVLCLVSLVLDHYIAPGARRCYICIPVFSAVIFGLLPWIAGFVPTVEIWKTALAGCIVFTASTFMFSTICDRIASGPAAKAAPVISALGLYFAVQCFSGIFF